MTPEQDQIVKLGEYALGGTGFISVMLYMFRKMIRGWSTDSLANTQENMQKQTLTTLHDEVIRLDVLVKGMQTEMQEVHLKLGQMKKVMLEAQVALIEVEIKLATCQCDKVDDIRTDLAAVRNKLLEIEL
jgi:KaiC/GvpD/RAD55 family RecA-like ATPase